MRKQADSKTFLLWLFILFLAGILSACGKKENVEIPEKTFGMDYMQEQELGSIVQVVCDADSAWAITATKNDPIHKWTLQTSGMGDREQIEWQSEYGKYDLISIAQYRGTLYAEIRNRENDSLEIRKYCTDGTWSVLMSTKLENWEDYAIMGSSFFVDGSENIYLVSGNRVTRFGEEGQEDGVWELQGNVCLWEENGGGQVECVTADSDGIALYELAETGVEKKWMSAASVQGTQSAHRVYGIRTTNKETLCLATDKEILFLDRASGNLLARTDTLKLGVSSVLAGYYDENEEIVRLFGTVGNGDGLCYSLLSRRDTSWEQKTELVYGMVGGVNNGETSSIWRAITTFNQTNQDYYVTIKNYDNNIDRLHTDMVAGNGPDIIDMTYSEYYESYAKKGYLENLSPYLEQSQYRDDIIWNVLDAYRIDDGLYLFTPQVQLRGIAIHPEYRIALEEWNMETFLKLVEQNEWEKILFEGQPENPEILLSHLLSGRQEELINWEQRKAFFETEEFVGMLELCRECAEADWSDADEWTSGEKRYHTLCQEVRFGGWFATYLSYVGVYGREYPVYGYPTLSGQVYEVMACSDSCAIYSGSSQKEGAWKFIESLLQESNQKYSGIVEPGFPVRSSILKDLAEESKGMKVRAGENTLTITDTEIKILEDILYNGNLRNGMIDPYIQSVVQEETAPYFAGDKDAWDVAHIIQSRVQLILSE